MIAIAGSLNLDIVAHVPTIPLPGETVVGSRLSQHLGGKGGNQAVAAARLGAPVVFFGAVGDDAVADTLIAGLADEGIDVAGVRRVAGPSGHALVNVNDHGDNAISVLPGANDALAPPPSPFPEGVRWLLLQLEVPMPTVLAWARAAQAAGVRVMLNAAPAAALPPTLLQAVDTLVVNEIEMTRLTGGDVEQAASLGPRCVVMTLAARGSVAWTEGRRVVQDGHDIWAVDSTGAGDTFAGALAAGLWQGRPFDEALERAGFAASLACMRRGAREGMPRSAELEHAMNDWRHDLLAAR